MPRSRWLASNMTMNGFRNILIREDAKIGIVRNVSRVINVITKG